MEKVVKIVSIRESDAQQHLDYWQTRTPRERLEAVEALRRCFYGTSARLERTAQLIKHVKRKEPGYFTDFSAKRNLL